MTESDPMVPTLESAAEHRMAPSHVQSVSIRDWYGGRDARRFLFARGEDRHVVPVEVPKPASPDYRFEVLQKWEGLVTDVGGGEFTADLRDLSDSAQPADIATFSVDEVSEGDESLLRLGAVFYWNIGFEVGPGGQKKRVSLLRFRRLANWTRGEVAVIGHEVSELERTFGTSTTR